MIKKTTLVCLSTAQLMACGGGSSGSDTPQAPPTSRTVQVVDGYLENATVCVDRNLDNRCAPNEFIEGTTDSMGRIEVAAADANYPLIANIIAGETKDSDQIALASKSYQMIAPAKINTINPFTSIAHLSGKSLEQIAADLNLPADVLTGNFVANRSTSIDAAISHLIARSITRDFPPALSDATPADLQATLMAYKDKADELANQLDIHELNKRVLHQAPDGSVSSDNQMVANLSDYLENNGEFQVTPLSKDDESTRANFDGTNVTGSFVGAAQRAYTTENNQLVLDATDSSSARAYQFIYLSHHLSVSYESSSKTYQVWTHKDLSSGYDLVISDDLLRSQTLTLLRSSINSADQGDLELVTLSFAKEGNQVSVDFADATPDVMATWTIESAPDLPDVIRIDPPEGSKAPTIRLGIMEDAAQHWLARDLSLNGRYALVLNDTNLAHTLFDFWRTRNDRFLQGHYTLADTVKGSEFAYFPMTNSLESDDVITAYQFRDDNVLCEADYSSKWVCDFNYSTLFNDMRLSHKGTYDFNFRRSNQFFIGLNQDNYPSIWLRDTPNRNITLERGWFAGKQWYWVRDINSDANSGPKPTMVSLNFRNATEVEITAPNAEPFTASWHIRPFVDDYRSFTSVYIDLPEDKRSIESLRGEDMIQFGVMASADDALVIEMTSTLTIARENLLLRSKDLAEYMVERWQAN
ncbi:hypothetical protein NL53_15880 [Vibrio variabilis]|uniref:Uncharacterized protein n=1 Tax=Vibrio variabilis TaxID=990271 RepID=A0ABR4Y8F0_9VIBR|nr:hypothetical protein [Vibrio variabilis]KHA59230.1 hypothetical protein NL53_15880 [Vibrio variabilis]